MSARRKVPSSGNGLQLLLPTRIRWGELWDWWVMLIHLHTHTYTSHTHMHAATQWHNKVSPASVCTYWRKALSSLLAGQRPSCPSHLDRRLNGGWGQRLWSDCQRRMMVMVPQGQSIGSFHCQGFFFFPCSQEKNDLLTVAWNFKPIWFPVPGKIPEGFGMKSKPLFGLPRLKKTQSFNDGNPRFGSAPKTNKLLLTQRPSYAHRTSQKSVCRIFVIRCWQTEKHNLLLQV